MRRTRRKRKKRNRRRRTTIKWRKTTEVNSTFLSRT